MKKYLLLFISVITLISGCIKEGFDAPNNISDPNVDVNQSILGLKREFLLSGTTNYSIDSNWTISGIVTANDKSGNFYKELVIQDSTAAIGIKIDQSSIYNDFPVGRRIFINLKGMAIGKYKNLISLGGYVDSVSTPGSFSLGYVISSKIKSNFIKGSLNNKIDAEEVEISNLNDDYQYKLIKIKGVEFQCQDLDYTYADAVNQVDASRYISNKNKEKIILRTSGYSNFAKEYLAQLNGDVTAIYTVYNSDKQLKIRDLNDLKFTNNRNDSCSQGAVISIKSLRNLYKDTTLQLNSFSIEGSVISDNTTNNLNSQNIIIQDATAGIMVRFSGSHNFKLNDKVKIGLSGSSLERYKGLLQINNVNLGSAKYVGTSPITPLEATIEEIENNFNNWESSLVKIKNVTIANGIFSGSKDISDNNGKKITLYTTSSATFASQNIPTGNVDIIGYLGLFNTTKQLQIRKPETDIIGGTILPIDTNAQAISIKQLRDKYTGTSISITNSYVEGTVISDKTNKNIGTNNVIIQDATAGIMVRYTGANTFNLSDKVKIILNGSNLELFKGLLQVNNVDITKSTKNGTNTITPQEVTLSEINTNYSNYESELVKVKNVTLPTGQYNGSKDLTDASSNKITLYTTSTATFANNTMPTGSLDVTGIVSIYNTTKQLQLRDPAIDVLSSGGGGSTSTPIDIRNLRNMYTSGNFKAGNYNITGIVISDKTNKNINTQNVTIQDATGGILVRFKSVHSFNLGDKVTIDISGDSVIRYKGLMEVDKVLLTKATLVNSGNNITPVITTLLNLENNFETFESTLIQVNNATITDTSTTNPGLYSGTKFVSDGTSNNIRLYTNSGATFASSSFPVGPKNITCIVNIFNTEKQIQIRNLSDVQ